MTHDLRDTGSHHHGVSSGAVHFLEQALHEDDLDRSHDGWGQRRTPERPPDSLELRRAPIRCSDEVVAG